MVTSENTGDKIKKAEGKPTTKKDKTVVFKEEPQTVL